MSPRLKKRSKRRVTLGVVAIFVGAFVLHRNRVNEQSEPTHAYLFGNDSSANLVSEELTPYLHGVASFQELCPHFYEAYHPTHRRAVLAAVSEASARFAVEDELLLAMMAAESNCKAHLRSRRGAVGLMQLMPSTAKWLGVENPFSVRENILGAAKYLAYLRNKFGGNITLAVAAYNSGPVAVKRHGALPPYPETRNYVKKVLSYYERLQGNVATKSA